MSQIRINNLTNKNGKDGPSIAGVSTVSSSAFMVMPSGDTAIRGAGSGRGIIAGSFNPSPTNIDKIEIATTGSATDFGSLVHQHGWSFPVASSTRAIFAGGYTNPLAIVSGIDYITISSGGGGNDFGEMITPLKQGAGFSDSTRGIFATGAGPSPAPVYSTISFVTMASTGSESNFGDALAAKRGGKGFASPTRGLFAQGGYLEAPATLVTNVIEYVNIQSGGNSVEFGDSTQAIEFRGAGASNNTRGLLAGGYTTPANKNIIDYVQIATLGNALDFGDLTEARHGGGGMTNATRAVFAGLWNGAANNVIDYVTIATTGDATDFGDATTTIYYADTCSDVHGGLG